MSDLTAIKDNNEHPYINNTKAQTENNNEIAIGVHNQRIEEMAAEECVNVGNNSPIEEGGDGVLNDALLTQPRNNIRNNGEDTSMPAMEFINRTILFNSNDKDNSFPSATTRFSGYYEMDPRNVEHNRIESSYIDRLYNSSDLIIANPKAAAKAFQKKGPLGLIPFIYPSKFYRIIYAECDSRIAQKRSIQRKENQTHNHQASLCSGS